MACRPLLLLTAPDITSTIKFMHINAHVQHTDRLLDMLRSLKHACLIQKFESTDE
jgi:hypothetical protein